MSKTCWCYTTDINYLLPTIVSAQQLRLRITHTNNDVYIIYIGGSLPILTEIRQVVENLNIIFIHAESNLLNGMPMICARLYINSLLGEQYSHMVYLDGDTQIKRDLSRFSELQPRPGSLLAAPDLMSLMINSPSRNWQKRSDYFSSIGISGQRQQEYFNSGVIKVGLSDWRSISNECVNLIKRSGPDFFKFKDQDALNIVMNGQHQLVSIRWNWPAFFTGSGLDTEITPEIVHFMSKPRPWDGKFYPWGAESHKPYQDFVTTYPQLKKLFFPFRGAKKIRYHTQQLVKRAYENWNTLEMRSQLALYEAKALR